MSFFFSGKVDMSYLKQGDITEIQSARDRPVRKDTDRSIL